MEEAKAAEFLKVWAQKLLVSYILLIIEVTEPTQMRRDIGVTSPWDEHQKKSWSSAPPVSTLLMLMSDVSS